jgi:cytochrome P450
LVGEIATARRSTAGRPWDGLLRREPWSVYLRYQTTNPILWSSRLGGYAAFTHQAVHRCLTGPEFRADHPFRATRRALGPTVLDLDGEPHRKLRGLLANPLRPQLAEEHRAAVGPIVRDVVRDVLSRPSDLGRIADDVPMRVIAGLLGLPTDDVARLYQLTRSLATYINQVPIALTQVRADLAALTDYLNGTLFATGWASDAPVGRAIVDGLRNQELSPTQAVRNTMLLLVSGTETTSCALANVLGAVLSRPDVWSGLREDRLDVSATILELLRLEPPVRVTPRFISEPVEVEGIQLEPGQLVNVGIASANRDTTRYPDSAEFSLERAGQPTPFTFGRGPHSCFGAFLSQLELGGVLTELINGPDIVLTDDPKRLRPGWTFRRPDRLRFRWADRMPSEQRRAIA